MLNEPRIGLIDHKTCNKPFSLLAKITFKKEEQKWQNYSKKFQKR